MPDRVLGCALFADISGFTPLTEALVAELGPRRGAEELSANLNLVFDAVLGELHQSGGSVIYFSGDAVTCWLDGDDGTLGVACALAMQRAMARVATITTPGGSTVHLGMKVAVAAGKARRFVVGDPKIQLIDVLAGDLMDRLAATEHEAERGEVVVDGRTLPALKGKVELLVMRGHGDAEVGVVGAFLNPLPPLPAPLPYPKLSRSVLRPWLLPSVYERVRSGRGEFLAELRPAVPMFVRFGGIDYDNDPDARQMLDHFIVRAQQVIDGYGGNLLNLTIGDKGAYLHAVFGCPLAHEDDAARACAAALEISALEGATAASGLQVGVACGRLRSGSYGHHHRRAFSCLGDPVNLAARLMGAAPPGQIYVTAEVAQDAGGSFSFEEMADLTLKGKAAPVAARRLTGRNQSGLHRQSRPVHPFIGRDAELAELLALADLARDGRGQVVAVVGEAGMGKSRLSTEAIEVLAQGGMQAYGGAAASVGSATSYLVWQGIFRSLLGLGPGAGTVAEIEAAVSSVDPGLVARLPLLSAVLGTHIEDNELTGAFDAKLRKSSLESLLLAYLAGRAQFEPLVLMLDDCHWIDALSADLLEVVARSVAALPVLVILTYRPGSFSAPDLPHTSVMELDRLDRDSCRQLVCNRLAELYGPEQVLPDVLLDRLTDRAEGNAFYLEELVNYLHAEGTDLSVGGMASLELPASLSSLLLSRIDTLTESPRRTLKVASVVGREFGVPVLTGAYPELGPKRQVNSNLKRLCTYELVVAEANDAYAFKHALIRDAAYESLPFALRSTLHGRIGTWLEVAEPDGLDLLAHHFWHSTDEAKKREYLLRAGEAAQSRFANAAAVDYFQRLVPLVSEEERPEVLLKLGAVLELRGDWAQAEAVYTEALELAGARGQTALAARARTARAEPVRKQGRFNEAVEELARAGHDFEVVGDQAGLGRIAHLRGTIAAQTGNYLEARAQYEQSLAIRMELGDRRGEASLLSNLAIVAEYEGDYEGAQELNAQALDLRTQVDDRWGIGVSRNNSGMVAYLRKDFEASRAHLEEALRLELEVGDLWMVAMARHNLGNTTRELGDRAATARHYADALATFAVLGDKWAQPIVLEDVAIMASAEDPRAALQLEGAAEALREAIGSPREAARQGELDERLGLAGDVLGPDADQARSEGRQLAPEAVLELAQQVCARALSASGPAPRGR